MKLQSFWKMSAGLVLAALPLVGGVDQEPIAEPAAAVPANQAIFAESTDLTGVPNPEEAEQNLENAPGEVVSTAQAPETLGLSVPASEVAKLARAGVDESVMMAFVTNSPYLFRLDSDDIIYLSDVGVPGTVVTAMIQHDQVLNGETPNTTNTMVAAAAPTNVTMIAEAPAPEVIAGGQPVEQVNVSYTYFYGSLAPYGSWININGYGLCWQPTVVVADRNWRPYCDRGRWVYSDCGWYWASDYSWGWAPYHYGRWFQHSRWGWCWAPDTVWGPSWVSWRFNRDHCAWAPLPPTACFTPGIGFTYYKRPVQASFAFGLRAKDFNCVPVSHFSDRHLNHHRVSGSELNTFVRNTTPANTIVQRDRTIINEGIPPTHVASVTRREIRSVRIRENADSNSSRFDRFDRDGRNLDVFRPNLPTPTRQVSMVGRGVTPAARVSDSRNSDRTPNDNVISTTSRRPTGGLGNSGPRERQLMTSPSQRNQPPIPLPADVQTETRPEAAGRDSRAPSRGNVQTETRPDAAARDARTNPRGNPTPPLILRGPDRSNSQRSGGNSDRGTLSPGIVPAPAPINADRTPAPTQPSTQPVVPQQNNPGSVSPNRQPPPAMIVPRPQSSAPVQDSDRADRSVARNSRNADPNPGPSRQDPPAGRNIFQRDNTPAQASAQRPAQAARNWNPEPVRQDGPAFRQSYQSHQRDNSPAQEPMQRPAQAARNFDSNPGPARQDGPAPRQMFQRDNSPAQSRGGGESQRPANQFTPAAVSSARSESRQGSSQQSSSQQQSQSSGRQNNNNNTSDSRGNSGNGANSGNGVNGDGRQVGGSARGNR